MLSKFASMFLANIFYNSKIIFKVQKRNTRLFHSWTLLDEVYDVCFKINGSLTIFKFCHGAKIKYPSLLVRQRQNVVLNTL